MIFTDEQQKQHRGEFIDDYRQKAWGAACHADFIAKGLDELFGHYKKIQDQDRTLEADIKELEGALDSHTADNRNKRKALNEKRQALAKQLEIISASAREGQKALADAAQSMDLNLRLASHAEKWEWAEAAIASGDELK
jgi:hypothetical protein